MSVLATARWMRLPACVLTLVTSAAACTPAPGTTQTHVEPKPTLATSVARASAPAAAPAITESAAEPAAPAPASAEAPPTAPPVASFSGGARAVRGTHGIVVAVEERAVRVGVRVLESGGNAVDAAIATAFALAVTHPSAASLGGGGFALVRAPHQETLGFDFVPTAPASLTRAEFERMIAADGFGKRAVGVPGIVAGLGILHDRFATKPLSELVAPAVDLARQGTTLASWPARLIALSFKELSRDRAARATFSRNGQPLKAGTPFAQPDLAWTLQRLASAGVDDFYRGEIAHRLARSLAPEGPSLEDLAAYRAVVREPLRVPYRGLTLETMPPPSAGGVALAGTLLAFSGAGSDPELGSAAAVHRLLEAQRRAQAERRLAVSDPDLLSASEQTARRARWLDPAFWTRLPIDAERATASLDIHPLYPGALHETAHTTHISVVDGAGMAVSLTITLCASFGARVVAGGTGLVMNNAVATFSMVGDNQPQPRKRTTSSMAPSLLSSGDRLLAIIGTPGGDTIPSTLSQIIYHLVDQRWPLDQAVEAPRVHHGFVPDEVRYEPALGRDAKLLNELRARGHRLHAFRHRIGDANCIVMEDAGAAGYADSREPGFALAARQ